MRIYGVLVGKLAGLNFCIDDIDDVAESEADGGDGEQAERRAGGPEDEVVGFIDVYAHYEGNDGVADRQYAKGDELTGQEAFYF